MAKYSDEKLRAALRGRKQVIVYPFPGIPGVPDAKIGIKALSDAETDSARLQAVVHCEKHKANLLADPEFLERAIHREVVSRACCDPDRTDEVFFSSQDEVAELDAMTVRSLYELYVTHLVALDPYAHCPPEEVEQLGEELVASPNPAGRLSWLDAPTLRNLLLTTMLRLREMSLTRS